MRAEKERTYTVRLDKILQDAVNFLFCIRMLHAVWQKCIMIFKKSVFPPSRYFPKSKKAAALLLYNLWSEKELQSSLKKVSWNLTSDCQDLLGFGCVLSVSYHSHLSQVFVRNRGRKIEGLGSVLRKKNAKWDTKVIWQRNPVTQVWKETRRTLFAHIQQHLKCRRIHAFTIHYPDTAPGKVQLRSWVCLCHFLQLQGNCWGGTLIWALLFVLQQGMSKSSFVNDVTTAVHKSFQVVD